MLIWFRVLIMKKVTVLWFSYLFVSVCICKESRMTVVKQKQGCIMSVVKRYIHSISHLCSLSFIFFLFPLRWIGIGHSNS